MQSILTIKVSKNQNVNWICFWPFSIDKFRFFMGDLELFESNKGFIVLNHLFWGEGFHPPKAAQVNASIIGDGEIGTIKNLKESIVLNNKLESIIDLKLYITNQEIDVDILKNAFLKGEHSKILELWGGYIFYIHDAEKFYIDFNEDKDIQALLTKLVYPQISLDVKDYTNLWNKLNNIDDDKCLLISIDDNNVLKVREISDDIQKYEKKDALISN